MKTFGLPFKDNLKIFWNKKEGKIAFSVVLVLIIFVVVYISSLLFSNPVSNNNQNIATTFKPLGTIEVNAKGLEYGSPMTLVDQKGNVKQILNGQTQNLESGKYTISSLIDIGNGKVKGINEQIEIVESQNVKIEPTIKEIPLNEVSSSAKALQTPTKIENIEGVESITNDKLQITKDSKDQNTTTIKYPKVILSPDKSKQTAAIVQPLLSRTSLIKKTTPTTSSSLLERGTNLPTSNTATPDISNISLEQRASLAMVSDGEQKILASDCLIGKAGFNQNGSMFRYFKVCDNGQNGFYQYNLETKQEERVLPSSDYANVLKVVTSPVTDLMVWTKPDQGQFGIVQNGQFEVILSNVYYTSPFFSPDGKYLIVMDNYLANKSPKEVQDLNLNESDQDQFGMKVRVTKVDDLLKNKEKAEFKEVGTTYFLPRPIDYDLEFIRFKDQTHFMAGDSSKVFSLLGEPVDNKLASDLPGQIYVLGSGKKYRVYKTDLFNEQNQVLATNVNQVIQLQDKSLYFKSGDFLFRLANDIPVQAFDKPVSSINLNQNILQLVLSDGSIATFPITN